MNEHLTYSITGQSCRFLRDRDKRGFLKISEPQFRMHFKELRKVGHRCKLFSTPAQIMEEAKYQRTTGYETLELRLYGLFTNEKPRISPCPLTPWKTNF